MTAIRNTISLLRKVLRAPGRGAMARRAASLIARLGSASRSLRLSRLGVARELMRAMAAEGMTHPDECLLLMMLAARVSGGSIVEVGSYRGRSTIALAIGSSRGGKAPVYAIEPHAAFTGVFGATFGPADRAAFLANVARARVAEAVRLVSLPSATAAAAWTEPIGLLWIDADHRYAAVRQDFEAWSRHLLPDAPVCFDDSTLPGAGPYQLVHELIAAGTHEAVDSVGKVTVLRRRPP